MPSTVELYRHKKNREQELKEELYDVETWICLEDNSRIRIANSRHSRVEEIRKAMWRYYGHNSDSRPYDVDDKVEYDIAIEVTARGIILDWEGITDSDGSLLPCTYHNIIYLLNQAPRIWDDVLSKAREDPRWDFLIWEQSH